MLTPEQKLAPKDTRELGDTLLEHIASLDCLGKRKRGEAAPLLAKQGTRSRFPQSTSIVLGYSGATKHLAEWQQEASKSMAWLARS